MIQDTADTFPVLDVACGGRTMYYDKQDPDVLFVDNRNESFSMGDGEAFNINPDIVLSFTNLPFPSSNFKMVIFDPPHLVTENHNSWQAKKYGVLPKDWKPFIKDGFKECFRVLEEGGSLIFKWTETSILIGEVLPLAAYKPVILDKGPGRGSKYAVYIKLQSKMRVILDEAL